MNLVPPSTRTGTQPTFIVRLVPVPTRKNKNLNAAHVGAISTTVIPITLTDSPLPDGPVLQTRIIGSYALSSDLDRLHESMADKVLHLEAVHVVGSRRVRQKIFVGALLSEELQYSATENAVNATWSTVALLDAEPVEMFLSFLSIGATLARMDEGDYWPKDYSGNRIARIDKSLFGLMQWTQMSDIPGSPVPQAFADVLRPRRKLIPVVSYDSTGGIVLTVRERGKTTRDLVVPSIADHTGARQRMPDVSALSGLIDYGRIVSRITGQGGEKKVADTVTLTPAWDRSLDSVVLSSPNIVDRDDRYREVGRLYALPENMWPLATAHGASTNTESPLVWVWDGIGDSWSRSDAQYEFMTTTAAGTRSVLDRKGSAGYTDGTYTHVFFNAPMVYRRYSAAQLQAREEGDSAYPAVGFHSIELQGFRQGGILTTDTGYHGTYPLQRRRIHKRSEYTALTAGRHYVDVGGRRTPANHEGTYDGTPGLAREISDLVEMSSDPKNSMTIRFPFFNPSLVHGITYTRIIDDRNRAIRDNIEYTVEGAITHTLRVTGDDAFTTSVNLDSDTARLLGGLTL